MHFKTFSYTMKHLMFRNQTHQLIVDQAFWNYLKIKTFFPSLLRSKAQNEPKESLKNHRIPRLLSKMMTMNDELTSFAGWIYEFSQTKDPILNVYLTFKCFFSSLNFGFNCLETWHSIVYDIWTLFWHLEFGQMKITIEKRPRLTLFSKKTCIWGWKQN